MDQQVASLGNREGAATAAGRLRSIFTGSVGNLVEWYDFYIYNSFAIYFAKQFSSSTDPTVQFLNVYGIYAIAFLVRPIGGVLLGNYADLYGRRSALTLSVTLMCAASLMIAVIPTYGQIGVAAPALLLVARMIQGVSLGGEYAASATYLSEVAGSRHRGFYSSFQYVTLIGGQVLAALLLIVMQQRLTDAELESWGWRVPFAIGALLAVYGLFLRRNMAETEAFTRAARTRTHSPLREVFRHPRELLLVFGLTMGGTAAFYTFSTYMPTFLTNTVHLTRGQATGVSFVTLFFFAALQPALGALSDQVGRKPVLLWFGIMGTLCTYGIMTAMAGSRNLVVITLLLMIALAIVSGYTAINAVVKAELFPAGVRALGVGLPYALGVSIFGGSAPYVALWFKDQGHEDWFFFYITALIFGSLLVYATMRDTQKASLITDLGVAGPSRPRAGAVAAAGGLAGRRPRSPLLRRGLLGAGVVAMIAVVALSRLLPGGEAPAAKQDDRLRPQPTADAAPVAPAPALPSVGLAAAPAAQTLPVPDAVPPAPSLAAVAAPEPPVAAAPVAVAPPAPAAPPAAPAAVAPGAVATAQLASAAVVPPAAGLAAAPPAVAAPAMIELPGATFRMGSAENPMERPAHPVAVAPFLLAKHATTVREWQQCVDAKACPPASSGRPDDPVTNLSWDDARQYVAWLSQATGQPYRLPTEAEWEYAARAGTETRYAWGNQILPGRVSCKGCAGPVSVQLPPRVDAYPPNAFGLLGMGGGVAEWVADCWHRSYQGAPRDGSTPWDAPACHDRVLRGGSWMEDAAAIRPASRGFYDASVRYPTHGVRVAQSK